jgi:hypothetical protein
MEPETALKVTEDGGWVHQKLRNAEEKGHDTNTIAEAQGQGGAPENTR